MALNCRDLTNRQVKLTGRRTQREDWAVPPRVVLQAILRKWYDILDVRPEKSPASFLLEVDHFAEEGYLLPQQLYRLLLPNSLD